MYMYPTIDTVGSGYPSGELHSPKRLLTRPTLYLPPLVWVATAQCPPVYAGGQLCGFPSVEPCLCPGLPGCCTVPTPSFTSCYHLFSFFPLHFHSLPFSLLLSLFFLSSFMAMGKGGDSGPEPTARQKCSKTQCPTWSAGWCCM